MNQGPWGRCVIEGHHKTAHNFTWLAPQLPVPPEDTADISQWKLAMHFRCRKVSVCHSSLTLPVEALLSLFFLHKVLPEPNPISSPVAGGDSEETEADDPLNGLSFLELSLSSLYVCSSLITFKNVIFVIYTAFKIILGRTLVHYDYYIIHRNRSFMHFLFI